MPMDVSVFIKKSQPQPAPCKDGKCRENKGELQGACQGM
jgi:hypothetical protein